MDLQNSTVLITGGTSGLGLELVKQLTAIGAKVIVTGRNLNALNEAKRLYPKIATLQSDVSNPDDIEQLYAIVTQQFPKLNIIINNAGLMRLIDLQDALPDIEDVTREINTNLSGTIQMVHKFLPHLAKQKQAGIVNVSSAIAFMPYTVAPIYSASKAGVHAYTQALRLQLQDTNIRVFEMIPPGVNTNLQNDWAVKPNPRMMMDADKMVATALKALRNNKPELKPFAVSIIKLVSRLLPGMLIKFGHREFKNFRQLNSNHIKS
ncbi:MAG: SDR family oxidoreductase [Flavobacterium sp.]